MKPFPRYRVIHKRTVPISRAAPMHKAGTVIAGLGVLYDFVFVPVITRVDVTPVGSANRSPDAIAGVAAAVRRYYAPPAAGARKGRKRQCRK